MPAPALIARLLSDLKDVGARHRERHRPTGCGFAVADRIDLLGGAAWDAVTAQASVLLQRPYLTALEAAAPAELAHRFALITRDGRPIAAVLCQILDLEGRRLHGAARSRWSGLRLAALDRLRLRTLVCGNLWTWGAHGVACAPGVDPATVWPAVGELLYRIRRAEALDGQPGVVLVKDLPATVDATGLRRLSYRPVETEPDMVLELRPAWRRFDDYTASLTGKYRKQIREVEAAVQAAGFAVAPLTDLAAESEALHALYLQVHARAAVRPVTSTPAYLPAVARALAPSGFRCTAIRSADGALAGFVTSFRDGDTVVAYQVGFDSSANARAPIYFRLLQAAVADGIALGGRRISFGRTALDAKARVGAQPVALAMWSRHRHQPLNVLLRPFLGLVPHAEAPERNPFKDRPGANP